MVACRRALSGSSRRSHWRTGARFGTTPAVTVDLQLMPGISLRQRPRRWAAGSDRGRSTVDFTLFRRLADLAEAGIQHAECGCAGCGRPPGSRIEHSRIHDRWRLQSECDGGIAGASQGSQPLFPSQVANCCCLPVVRRAIARTSSDGTTWTVLAGSGEWSARQLMSRVLLRDDSGGLLFIFVRPQNDKCKSANQKKKPSQRKTPAGCLLCLGRGHSLARQPRLRQRAPVSDC